MIWHDISKRPLGFPADFLVQLPVGDLVSWAGVEQGTKGQLGCTDRMGESEMDVLLPQ